MADFLTLVSDYQRRWRWGQRLREIREQTTLLGGALLAALRGLVQQAERLAVRAAGIGRPMDLELHQLDRRYEALRTTSRERDSRVLASLARDGRQLPVVVAAGADAGRYVLVDGHERVRGRHEALLVALGARQPSRSHCASPGHRPAAAQHESHRDS